MKRIRSMRAVLSMIVLIIAIGVVLKIHNESCTEENFVFEAENRDWSARLEMDIIIESTKHDGVEKYDTEVREYFTLDYKNDFSDLLNRFIECNYKTSYDDSSYKKFVKAEDSNNIFEIRSFRNLGDLLEYSEDETVEIIIRVDDVFERFEMIRVEL